jgi:hypothetical protein
MNSSISTSEPARWGPTLRLYAVACVVLGAAIAALLVMFDPYDTGRLAIVTGYGVPQMGQGLAVASVAREADAAAAVIGNSTIQLVDPARLTDLTGVRFVSLAIPGSGPIEQLAVADWYLRQHRRGGVHPNRALVFGLDQTWCQSDGSIAIIHPFPFWLYSASTLDYIVNLMRLKTFEAAERKLKVVLGRDKPLRADGYRDYDSDHEWPAGGVRGELDLPADDGAMPARVDFAAASRLRAFLAELPTETNVVLVFPPRYFNGLPAPGSGAAAVFARCKETYREFAATRARTSVVDFAVDGEIARDDRLFWDRMHYRQSVARIVEHGIAGAMRPREVAHD